MPVHIGQVDMDMDVLPESGTSAREDAATPAGGTERLLRERLRPIVLDILGEELERMRRQHG